MAKLPIPPWERAVVLPTLEKELWQSWSRAADWAELVLPTLEKELWQSLLLLFLDELGSCRRWKRNCGKALPRRSARRCGLADAGKGTVAKQRRKNGEIHVVLPTLEKELWQSLCVHSLLLPESCRRWKRNCGKAEGRWEHDSRCLADAGKGTVAKRDGGEGGDEGVLPTLEKELWQSGGALTFQSRDVLPTLEKELWQSPRRQRSGRPRVLPTLEKELWQSRCGGLYDSAWGYVKFLPQV